MILKEIIEKEFPNIEIFEVWYCKTLQNAKGIYYLYDKELFIEATLDGNECKVYIDSYVKVDNKVIDL